MCQRWSVLLVLFIALATARSAEDEETVCEYTVSVGSEDHGHEHHGFALKMRIAINRDIQTVYHFHIDEVQLLNENNEALAENSQTTKLKADLRVPFEFKMSEALPLKIFSPETLESESVNIKRGLINLWRSFDRSKGKAYGAEVDGPSGKCRESFYTTEADEGKQSQNFNRFNSFQNCTPTVKHEETKTQSMKTHGAKESKIIRTVSYEYRLGLRPKDPTDIKSTERIQFDSSLPRGLFDVLVIKQHLKTIEVRDANEVTENGGESASTTLEVNLPLQKAKDQAEALSLSVGLFNKLMKDLNETSAITDLRDTKLPADVLGLNYFLSQLNQENIEKVYETSHSAENKDLLFAQMMAFSGKFSLKSLTPKDCESSDPSTCLTLEHWRKYSKGLTLYYEKLASQGNFASMTLNDVEDCISILNKLEEKGHPINAPEFESFSNSLTASCSSLIHRSCIKDDDCKYQSEYSIKTPLPEEADSDADLRHRINAYKNMHSVGSLPILIGIIWDTTKCIKLRTHAAWAVLSIGKHHPKEVQEFAFVALADRKEDHEIRIAAFMMTLLDNNLGKIQTLVQYLVDNHEQEDRELVTFVFTYFKAVASVKGSLWKGPHKSHFETAKFIYENMLEGHEKSMAPKTIFSSCNHIMEREDSQLIVSTIASKTDLIPRHVYISYSDPQQSRSVSFSMFSKNFHLKLMAKLKKSMAANVLKYSGGSLAANRVKRSPIDSPLLFDDEDDSLPGYFSVNVNGYDVKFDTFKNYKELQMKFHENLYIFKEVAHILNIFNTIKATTHTESGLRVGFYTTQGAVNSVAMPVIEERYQWKEGRYHQQSMSIRMPRTQLQSTAYFTSFVSLPETDYRFISGKKSEKAINLPHLGLDLKMASMSSLELDSKWLEISPYIEVVKEEFTKPFDVYYRSLNKFVATVSGVNPMELPLKPETTPTKVAHSQYHLAFGYRVEKTVGYERPSITTSPLTRWSLGYQDIDCHSTPFTYKISLTPHSNPNLGPRSRVRMMFLKGMDPKGHVKQMMLSVENVILKENNPESRSFAHPLNVFLEKRVSVSETKKRIYEMRFKSKPMKTFITSKWSAVSHDYPEVPSKDETIAIKGSMSFEDDSHEEPEHEAHDSHGAHGDHGGHGAQSSPAHEGHESHGAHECLVFNGTLYRTEEQKGMSLGDDEDLIIKAMLEDMDDPRDYKDTCYARKRFLGFSLDMNILREPTEGVKRLYHKFRDGLVQRHFRHISYDVNDKLDQNTITLRMNSSSSDPQHNDMSIQDKNGKQIFTGFHSKVLPYLIRSSCTLKPSRLHDMKKVVCGLRVYDDLRKPKLVGATFDGHLFKNESIDECVYQLASDCDDKSFSVNYHKERDLIEANYGDTKITIRSKAILVNGVDVTPKVGTLGMAAGPIFMAATVSDAVLVMLPNQVGIAFMPGTAPDIKHIFVSSSRTMRGKFCGICGNMNGDPSDDSAAPQCRVYGNEVDRMAQSLDRLNSDLLRAMVEKEPKSNVFFSPLSIASAFSMLLLGAKEKTQLELFRGLGLNGFFEGSLDIHPAFRQTLTTLKSTTSRNNSYTLDVANKALVSQNLKVLNAFRQNLTKNYLSAIEEVDFAANGQKVLEDINKWVATTTHDKIVDFLKEPLDPATMMFIVNAIYFRGKWENKFDAKQTKPGPFKNYGKSDQINDRVEFMSKQAKFKFSNGDGYELLELPYEGNASMIIALPAVDSTVENFIRTTRLEALMRDIKSMRSAQITVKLPKFKLEKEYDLQPIMTSLGVKDVFTNEANLSGISGSSKLFVSKALHKAIIEVDEDGTQAAAVTGIAMGFRSARHPLAFIVDRPFIFFIRDNLAQMTLFAGIINKL